MTSKERHQQRYLRRVAKRQRNKEKVSIYSDNFNLSLSFTNLYKSYKQCKKGVGWKASTQLYKSNAIYNVYVTYKRLQNKTFKSDGFFEFRLNERGKCRDIKSVTIRERVVQRCLCDYSLTPMLSRVLIHDNGASSKGKGISFSIARLEYHLRKYYIANGSDGYALLYDFSKFFDSLQHWLLKSIIARIFKDQNLINLIYHFIDMFGVRGIGLGSQISQNMALVAVNELDHYIKERLRVVGYGRYMDDGYLINQDKNYLHFCLNEITTICERLEVNINKKKTHISKINKGFTYLKIKFQVLPSGKILKRIDPRSVTRMRRKLKKFVAFVKSGKMTLEDVYQSYQSWRSRAIKLDAYRTRQNMEILYQKLFGGNNVQNS